MVRNILNQPFRNSKANRKAMMLVLGIVAFSMKTPFQWWRLDVPVKSGIPLTYEMIAFALVVYIIFLLRPQNLRGIS